MCGPVIQAGWLLRLVDCHAWPYGKALCRSGMQHTVPQSDSDVNTDVGVRSKLG